MSGTDVLLQYGPLGVFAALGVWLVKDTISGLRAERDGLRAERDAERAYSRQLEDRLREQIIPLLTITQQATADATRLIVQQAALFDERKRGPGS